MVPGVPGVLGVPVVLGAYVPATVTTLPTIEVIVNVPLAKDGVMFTTDTVCPGTNAAAESSVNRRTPAESVNAVVTFAAIGVVHRITSAPVFGSRNPPTGFGTGPTG